MTSEVGVMTSNVRAVGVAVGGGEGSNGRM